MSALGLVLSTHEVLSRFRTGFLGKASPVHFFWGSFALGARLWPLQSCKLMPILFHVDRGLSGVTNLLDA